MGEETQYLRHRFTQRTGEPQPSLKIFIYNVLSYCGFIYLFFLANQFYLVFQSHPKRQKRLRYFWTFSGS